jgi:cell wall-associated NlpC family hydrolase
MKGTIESKTQSSAEDATCGILGCLGWQNWLPVLVLVMLSGCASTPEIKPSAQQASSNVVNYALSLQGTPYRYGKETPEDGFDCSGFVRHVYGRHGVWLPRTVREMASYLPAVPKTALQSGDLVLFHTGGGNYFSHIGIFIKSDQFIHAPSSRTGRVLVSSLNNQYWRKRFVGVRRPGKTRSPVAMQ